MEKQAESESAAAFSGRQCESHDRGCAFDRRSGEADPDRLPGTENCQKPNKNHLRKGTYVPNPEQQELPASISESRSSTRKALSMQRSAMSSAKNSLKRKSTSEGPAARADEGGREEAE